MTQNSDNSSMTFWQILLRLLPAILAVLIASWLMVTSIQNSWQIWFMIAVQLALYAWTGWLFWPRK